MLSTITSSIHRRPDTSRISSSVHCNQAAAVTWRALHFKRPAARLETIEASWTQTSLSIAEFSSNKGGNSSMQSEQWSLSQVGQARPAHASHRPDVHVVLVEPQIPQNTGNVARTCAATNVALHLVGPLGFEIDDKKLKRAGLDYWDNVCVHLHDNWDDFFSYFQALPGRKRLVGFSVYGDQYYGAPEFEYNPGDWLLFGAETTGLPMKAHDDIRLCGGSLVKIPIVDTYVRSLNQSVSVGVGVFEAIRQLDIGRHSVQPREDTSSPMVRLPTPMMVHQQRL